jgi:hypothetical protein
MFFRQSNKIGQISEAAFAFQLDVIWLFLAETADARLLE